MATRVEHVMGMPIVVEAGDDAAFDDVFAWFRRVDETFSTFRPSSEVSRIARGELDVADVQPDVARVLRRCEQLRAETGGYFDACARGALDPSGLVKGWSVDRAAELLGDDFAIYAGGDVLVRGRTRRIGIRHPTTRGAIAKVLEGESLAVATSGEYERGPHIVDPHSGRPPEGLLSVTITGPDLATADAYATAAFAMGALRAPHWVARLQGYDALLILADGRVLSTPSLRCAA